MDSKAFEAKLENALRASILSAYAQGYDLIVRASEKENWGVDLSEVSRIWQGGCIIRATILTTLRNAFRNASEGKAPHLFEIPEMRKLMDSALSDWKETVSECALSGVPAPAMSAGLSYFESLTDSSLPANYLQ